MKTDPESSPAAAPTTEHLKEELRPQVNAIVEMAKLLKTKAESDENAQQILTAARALLGVIDREPREARHSNSASEPGSTEPCDVLYIEDNPRIFASVKLLLGSKRALKLLQATNGETGFALAQTRMPKLILLDLDLPDIHGSEVIQHLQKDPATARIPVVVISGDATPSQIERLLVLGARNYLTKPFSAEPFLAVVDEVMQENAVARGS
ncbi:MAG TPA: response regulator [Chthoniobacterales bacterium]|nr:response regulator [Chthoniobacterales bacterium]